MTITSGHLTNSNSAPRRALVSIGRLTVGVFLLALAVQSAPAAEIDLLRVRALTGDAVAQCMMGEAYYSGTGVRANAATAAHWLRLAADQGDHEAQGRLGELYLVGDGVPQNDAEASHWLTLSDGALTRKAYAKALREGLGEIRHEALPVVFAVDGPAHVVAR